MPAEPTDAARDPSSEARRWRSGASDEKLPCGRYITHHTLTDGVYDMGLTKLAPQSKACAVDRHAPHGFRVIVRKLHRCIRMLV